jgi:glutathione peroxidase
MSLFSISVSGNYDKLAYDFNFNDLDGSVLNLSEFKNKIMVIVNVASKCGFTSQYDDLQKVWEKYRKKEIVLIGVPSNDFGNQEPGNNEDIKNFCEAKFGITYPMTEKVIVKGKNAHPFYKWAKENHGNSAVPKWNFHKIIVGKNGKVIDTFASITNPSSKKFVGALEKALQQN